MRAHGRASKMASEALAETVYLHFADTDLDIAKGASPQDSLCRKAWDRVCVQRPRNRSSRWR